MSAIFVTMFCECEELTLHCWWCCTTFQF